ncbi:amidohydrolase [Nesterenkonia natronophila]|uniref:Amidohydrolase 3 domain-containing protein n=1 Tax=Nesterenkonia natronophila TaxID=2174932 RepID=A0A3A4F356_9MICC|nr:amidohydrolase family protein [Nesterenkonia natronophila]RJN32752.1 hypothetical protein D3250_02715 [Nesterenkonia natronophila]
MSAVLLTDVRTAGDAHPRDVLVRNGEVSAIAPAGELASERGVDQHDAAGRTLLPGLWDHHVHFTQWTIQRQRLDLTATESAREVLALVSEAARDASGRRRVVGFGFRDGLWPEPASLDALDQATGPVPAVLVSADLHAVWLNSAAQHELCVRTDASGTLRETEAFAVLEKLDSTADLTSEDYQQSAADAAAHGVVGVVDFENDDNATLWPQRVASGVNSLRVEISAWPDKLAGVIARGLKTGDLLDPQGLVRMGPLKVIVDGSLNTRTAWCWDPYPGIPTGSPHRCGVEAVPVSELADLMTDAKNAGIVAAIHAIGDRANTEVLNTFEQLGMTGTVEHAQLLRDQDVPRFAELGLTASVQPEHAMDDRDVADVYWEGRTGRAFALQSLHQAGVRLRLGSDAPVSPLNPWAQVAAAVTRSREGRAPWHPEQAITVQTALEASTRAGLKVEQGDLADLILVDYDPLTCDPYLLRSMPVAATMLAGSFTHFAL